jgi:hypothetical protein
VTCAAFNWQFAEILEYKTSLVTDLDKALSRIHIGARMQQIAMD